MNTFLDYCYSTFQRNSRTSPKKRPNSPSPFNSKWKDRHDCRNFNCIQDTNDVSNWKKVQYRQMDFYFCSEDCWNEWMAEPATMGCWSPPMAPKESLASVEALSLEN